MGKEPKLSKEVGIPVEYLGNPGCPEKTGIPGGRIEAGLASTEIRKGIAIHTAEKRKSRQRTRLFRRRGDAQGSILTTDESITDRFERREGLAAQVEGEEFDANVHGRQAYEDGIRGDEDLGVI